MPTPRIFVIHENDEWMLPSRQALEALGAPYEEWFLDELALYLGAVPPEGIFFSRMSASILPSATAMPRRAPTSC